MPAPDQFKTSAPKPLAYKPNDVAALRRMLLDVDWHRGTPYYAYSSRNMSWSQTEFRRAYRCNADRLEKLVIASVAEFLCDRRRLRTALKGLGLFGDELEDLAAKGKSTAARLEKVVPERLEELFTALLIGIEIGEECLSIFFRSVELRRLLLWTGNTVFRGQQSDWPCSEARYQLDIAVRAISAERWPVLVINARDQTAGVKPNPKLIELLQSARKAQRLVEDNRDLSLNDLARISDCRPAHFSKLIRLNYLAPDIVTAILDGAQPSTMTHDVLLKATLPTDWALQRRLFGFPMLERPRKPQQIYGRGLWPAANPVVGNTY